MWIVRLALRRPYTFIVLALLIVLLGVFTILRTPTDIFPAINIPVVSTIWSYVGLPPEDMANRIVSNAERYAQTTVNDVEHTESQSLPGMSVVKYFFQPNVNEDLSYAQITGVSQTLLRQAPLGTTPPFILAYNASTVPILQLALESSTLSEATLFDLGNSVIRPGLSTGSGCFAALSLWRQAAPGAGRHRSGGAALQGPVGGRCQQCHQRAEPDHPGRDRENRRY